MIQLDLGLEPDALRETRESQLTVAVARWNAWQSELGNTDKKRDFQDAIDGYRVAVDALHERQHGKCAYCERATGKAGSPTEHVRPKLGAEHEIGVRPGRDRERYWWLAWTWNNLLFACATCNCTHNKGNRFPLEVGSPLMATPTAPAALPLSDACYDTMVERRLFVDPWEDDPLEHLEWVPTNRDAAPSTWIFAVSGMTPKGVTTRDVLELEAVVEDIQAYFALALWPWVDEIQKCRAENRLGDARETWRQLGERVLNASRAPFRGPCYWAMRHAHSRLGLSAIGCSLPRRPAVRP